MKSLEYTKDEDVVRSVAVLSIYGISLWHKAGLSRIYGCRYVGRKKVVLIIL